MMTGNSKIKIVPIKKADLSELNNEYYLSKEAYLALKSLSSDDHCDYSLSVTTIYEYDRYYNAKVWKVHNYITPYGQEGDILIQLKLDES